MECTHAMCVNPGAVPSFVQGMMLKAHQKILLDQITYMNKHKDRLLNLWENEVKLIVQSIFERQRPKPVIVEEVVEQIVPHNQSVRQVTDSEEVVNQFIQEEEGQTDLKQIEAILTAQIDQTDVKPSDNKVRVKQLAYRITTKEESIKSAQNAYNNCSKPCKLTWTDINYTVKIKNQSAAARYTGQPQVDLHVLKGVSGYALPGQTLFIMGASGAGKTSLLNIICDRINTNNRQVKLTGKVLINNQHAVKQETIGSVASFVMQDDVLFEYLTVRECLTFAARLRLHKIPEPE